jgi:hypothetical protein
MAIKHARPKRPADAGKEIDVGTTQIRSSANARRLGYVLGVTVCVMALPTPGSAQTAAERAACTPDVFRLCAEEIPNVRRIIACMRVRRVRLSGHCRPIFDRYVR